jgi:hypothetical protein
MDLHEVLSTCVFEELSLDVGAIRCLNDVQETRIRILNVRQLFLLFLCAELGPGKLLFLDFT